MKMINPMKMLVIGEFLEKHNESDNLLIIFKDICEQLMNCNSEFLKIINEELAKTVNKPRMYHHTCHAGSTFGPLIDTWSESSTINCGNTGDGSGTIGGGGFVNGPACRRGCNRMIDGVLEISNNERHYNSGAEILANTIRKRLLPNNSNSM